jgi:hypothetical protein
MNDRSYVSDRSQDAARLHMYTGVVLASFEAWYVITLRLVKDLPNSIKSHIPSYLPEL